MSRRPHITVIGAGAFGGWTALQLLERGARVTLVDAWEPGHPRGTSNDESRLIRCGYGTKPIYTEWTWRARKLWRRWERAWDTELFVPTGVLWLCAREDDYTRSSQAALASHGVPFERYTARELGRRYPQISTCGLEFAYFEPRAGFLRARAAVMRVAAAVARHPRGQVLLARALAPRAKLGSHTWSSNLQTRSSDSSLVARHSSLATVLKRIRLSTGASLRADAFIFACGPWLPKLFPAVLGKRIRVSKQEVFYFGLPAGEARFSVPALPAWIEPASDFYGVPAADGRGFKIAYDRSGPAFNPDTGDRGFDPKNVAIVRRHLARRFPALAHAPLSEVRVCQYERTPDSHLVIDRHPEYDNAWLVGGGSGHGFKLGPAVGEFVAAQLLAARPAPIPLQMRLAGPEWPARGGVATPSF